MLWAINLHDVTNIIIIIIIIIAFKGAVQDFLQSPHSVIYTVDVSNLLVYSDQLR